MLAACVNVVVVGVADLATAGPTARLVTYALGSCIGLSAWDPVTRTGGLLHYMLPQPAAGADPRTVQPCVYASTGIPLLLRRLTALGAVPARLVLCAAGGAEILGNAALAIGKRNRAMLRRLSWQLGLTLAAEDTGGTIARTMTLDVATGSVHVRSRDDDGVLWAPGRSPAAGLVQP